MVHNDDEHRFGVRVAQDTALGFPSQTFTVLFAIGRSPGWIANWMEMNSDPDTRIMRPRQIYVGEPARDFVPLDQR
jgi:citrate synthase